MKSTDIRARRWFAGLFVVAALTIVAAAANAQQARQITSGFGTGAYSPGNGVKSPELLKQVAPVYPAAAKAAGVEGDVELEAIVKADGTVGDIRVVKSLDAVMGSDDAAIAAAKQWLFAPGKLNDQPVPVLVTLILTFRQRATGGGGANALPAVEGRVQLVPTSTDSFGKGATVENAAGLVNPELIKSKEPQYTSDAMRAKLQGTVELQAVVMPDGSVGEVRITKSLDTVTGLDDQAVAAVKQWLFKPGEMRGRPVPVIVTLKLTFRLH